MALKREQTLAEAGELAWLRRVRGWFGAGGGPQARVELGIGDDAALLRTGPRTVATSDTLIENVHFRLHTIAPRELGYKALVVNLSDLAAMAARPVAALLNVSVPAHTPLSMLQEFFAGVRAASRKFHCPIAGGDMTAAAAWHITVTALGEPLGRRAPLRSVARPGDYLYATGAPGESGAGLFALEHGLPAPPPLLRRHRLPTPRLAEAARLARICPRLAMLDVSDGIYNDAGQLARASGVALELRVAEFIMGKALRQFAAAVGKPPEEFYLFGGEDYELLFACPLPPAALQKKYSPTRGLAKIHCLGRVLNGKDVRLADAAGKPLKIPDQTFQHYQL